MPITKFFAVVLLTASAMGQVIMQGGASAQGTQTIVSSSAIAPPPTLQITTTCPLASGQVNVAYSQTLNGTGGTLPYSWTEVGSLPTGLSLSTSGQLSGTPTVAATSTFNVTATDASVPPQTSTVTSCQLTINSAPPPPLQITTTSLPPGFVSIAYSQSINAIGGTPPYLCTLASGGLPSGLTLSNNCLISGTPTTVQTNNFTVQAADASTPTQTATQALSITVNAAPPPVTGAQLPINWVNPHECDTALSTPDVTITLGAGAYANTLAGLQKSMDDWAAAANQWWKVVVPRGSTFQGGFKWKAKTGATKCIVYVSSTPLPAGVTACSHGIQDNHELAASTTDPGYRNPGCDGHSVEYQNGTQTPVVIGANAAFNDKASMYTLYYSFAGSSIPAISCAGFDTNNIGCHHIAMFDVEVAPSPDNSTHRLAFNNSAVEINTSATVQSQYPQHVHFNRFYFHSDIPDNPSTSCPGCYSGFGTFVNFWASFGSMSNGYFDQIANNSGAESHILGFINAPGPLEIVHNWVEGSSINYMSGGNQPSILGSVPTDIVLRRNRFTKPAPWMNASYCGIGNFFSLKSDGEFKVGNRILLDGNIYEYSCATAQDGQTRTFTVRDACNGGNSACDTNYSAVIQDLTDSNNIGRHAENGVQLDARSGGLGNGAGASLPGRRWTFSNDLFYNIGNTAVFGSHTPNYIIREGSAGNGWNSCLVQRDVNGAIVTVDCTGSPQNAVGFRQLQMSTGDLISVTGCVSGGSLPDPTPASFQTGGATKGTPLSSGVPTSLIVTYPNAGTRNATALCNIANGQGFPNLFKVSHVTAVGQSTNFRMPAQSGQQFPVQNTFIDSLFAIDLAGGWFSPPSQSEGTPSEASWDTSTLVGHHLVFPERTASKYTEYGGVNSGVSPPLTMYFPLHIPCGTANATTEATCVGFTGEMSGAAFNMNPADYHDFVLHSTSPFRTGGTKPASDGTDMGANISAIDNAQTQTQYTCSTDCTNSGANHGPWPD